jgi:uncharacterized membrane protein YbhN (UPF0104 family)
MPRRWIPLLKLGASLLLVGWVASALDLDALAHALGGIDALGLVAAILLLVTQSLVIGWRWRRIVHRLGGQMRGGDAVRWVLIGQFFNGALPTSIGGDALRIWLLHRSGVGGELAVQSVLIERVSGLVVLGLIVSSCVPAIWSATAQAPVATLGLAAAGPVLALAVVGLVLFGRIGSDLLPRRAAIALRTTIDSLRPFVRSPRLVAEVAGMACIASLIGLAAGHVLAHALGITTSFPATAALLGGAVILSLAPVSLGGWGVREVGMVALFGSVGVPAERALALSLLWGVLPLLIALPAFLIWRSDRSAPPAPTAESPPP